MGRILLVEDSDVQRRAVESLLESAGHEVVSFPDGEAAWEWLQNERPALVLTDLEMPRMDGLSLLRRIRGEGWRLPVVVMTAHGSEEIAADALRAGATSYVPKTQIDAELLETVDELLTYVTGETGYDRLMAHVRRAQFEFELDNDPALISPLVDLVQQMIASISPLARHERLQVGVAFDQALQNALFHGNLEISGTGLAAVHRLSSDASPEELEKGEEISRRRSSAPYDQRKTHVVATVEPSHVQLQIRDEGPGFEHQRVLQELKLGDRQGGSVEQPGRGLVLMEAFVDELTFSGKGNEVTLRKFCHVRSEEPTEGNNVVTEPSRSSGRLGKPGLDPAASSPPILATLRAVGGSETWTLTTRRATIGRDRSCDIVVSHADVSAHHCQLFLHEGWWFVTDLRTKNGIRVNGVRFSVRHLGPQDVLSVARHKLVIDYDPGALGAVGPTPPPDPF